MNTDTRHSLIAATLVLLGLTILTFSLTHLSNKLEEGGGMRQIIIEDARSIRRMFEEIMEEPENE